MKKETVSDLWNFIDELVKKGGDEEKLRLLLERTFEELYKWGSKK